MGWVDLVAEASEPTTGLATPPYLLKLIDSAGAQFVLEATHA